VSFWIIHKTDFRDVARSLAHEMGHHAYRVLLNSEGRKFWSEAVHGGNTTLDLREVLKKMNPEESFSDFDKRIQKEDPILSLQLDTLLYDPTYRDLDLLGSQSIRDYLGKGEDPIVRVPLKPITGYAAKNEDEAFAETVGMLVGYGSKAVLPEVIHRLRLLVPGMKVARSKPGKRGDCFEAAGRYLLEHAVFGHETNLKLVHGEVAGQGPLEGTTYGHAWVEDGDMVIDVSNGRDIHMPKQLYYLIGGISEINNVHHYSPVEFKKKVAQFKHWGPWDLKTATGL